jgi:galactokinase
MDQFVVAGAVANRAMLIDCRSLEYELLPLPDEVKVVICNSMVKHAVATREYGNRRDEVEAGQAVLRRRFSHVELVRDATLQDLKACRYEMSEESLARRRHIISENARVLKAREALLHSDLEQFGRLLVEAHVSMRDDFSASCEEVDALVEIATKQDGCLGARITGGGFGGCTVNLIGGDHADRFIGEIQRQYERSKGIMCVNLPTALWRSQRGRRHDEFTGANESASPVQSFEAREGAGVSQPNAKAVAGASGENRECRGVGLFS